MLLIIFMFSVFGCFDSDTNFSDEKLSAQMVVDLNREQDKRFRFRVEREQNIHMQSSESTNSDEYFLLLDKARNYRRKLDLDVTKNNHPELHRYLIDNPDVILPLDSELKLGLKRGVGGDRDPVAIDAIGFSGLNDSVLDNHLLQLKAKKLQELQMIEHASHAGSKLITILSFSELRRYQVAFSGKRGAFRTLLITTIADGKTYLQPRRWVLKSETEGGFLYKGVHTAPASFKHRNALLNEVQAGKDFGSIIFVTLEQGREVERLVTKGKRREAEDMVSIIQSMPQPLDAIHVLILPKTGHTRFYGGPESHNILAVRAVVDDAMRTAALDGVIRVFRHEGVDAFPREFNQVSKEFESMSIFDSDYPSSY